MARVYCSLDGVEKRDNGRVELLVRGVERGGLDEGVLVFDETEDRVDEGLERVGTHESGSTLG